MDDFNGDIVEFYNGQTILLTGATGFLGKIIIEKLLRTCPDIKRLFLLIRTKKGVHPLERLNELFNNSVFDTMKKENPDYLKKVTLVPGDVSYPNIGLLESDREVIVNEVTVVFHGAATVRFNESLKNAVNININGTKRVLALCGECRNLKAVVHISTAFSNCNKQEVKEQLYPPPVSVRDIIKIAENTEDGILEILTPMIMQDWPNTYSFSKQICEDIVRTEVVSKNIPTAIFRPAVVVGAYAEPIPGWIDNIYGPTGITVATGVGVLRTMMYEGAKRSELVPVDMVVNATLAIAWDVANNSRNAANYNDEKTVISVYNLSLSKQNPLTWDDYNRFNYLYGFKWPTSKAVWYTSLTNAKYYSVYYFFSFFLHVLPALLVDTTLFILGKPPKALSVYQRVHKFLMMIKYFCTNEWNFHTENTDKLWKKLSEKDKILFNFDMSTVNWGSFFENNIKGMRIFVLKESPDTIPAARRKLCMLHVLHRLIQSVTVLTVFWVMWPPLQALSSWITNWLTSLGQINYYF